ncbi:MAG: hypothetical protein ACRELE_11205 [Gemmatimonadales bacterium]
MNLAGPTRRAVAMALGLAWGACRASAQTAATGRWELEGSSSAYCIWYLADPALAQAMVPAGTTLAPAGSGAGLPALLARTVQDEPRFAPWIPGSICIGSYQRVTSGGRTLAHGKGDRPVIVATSALAARQARGFPTASSYLIDFMTDQRSLARAADDAGFGMGSITVTTRTRVGVDDPQVLIAIDGLRITWSGHAIGDSGVGTTRSVSFGYGTGRGGAWLIELQSAPATSRLAVGTLELDGRNTLAKALKSSPVRSIGPMESGGTASLTFQRATRN